MLGLKNRIQGISADFLLLLVLLFWIPQESTLPGRFYNYLVGLNSGSLGLDISAIYIQWVLVFTVVVPVLIIMITNPVGGSCGAMRLVQLGLMLWMFGGAISTLARLENPVVLLNFAAGILSGFMVFFAVRRVGIQSVQQHEIVYRTIAVAALIPCIEDLYRYYKTWGFPSLLQIIAIKYRPEFWSDRCFFGNPDNASCAYGLFAMISLGVIFAKLFNRKTRILAWITLVLCSIEVLLTMARTGIAFLVVAVIVSSAFARGRRLAWGLGALTLLAVWLSQGGISVDRLVTYFAPAVSYNSQDSNTASRIESMREGWAAFRDNPLTGIGIGQAGQVVYADVPHELALWQATEDGIFGFLGVLLVMIGCIARLYGLILKGPRSVSVRLEFAFFLAPALYFVRGLVSNAPVSNSVFNSWICFTFAMLAISDRQALSDSLEGRGAALAHRDTCSFGVNQTL